MNKEVLYGRNRMKQYYPELRYIVRAKLDLDIQECDTLSFVESDELAKAFYHKIKYKNNIIKNTFSISDETIETKMNSLKKRHEDRDFYLILNFEDIFWAVKTKGKFLFSNYLKIINDIDGDCFSLSDIDLNNGYSLDKYDYCGSVFLDEFFWGTIW